MMSIDRAIRYSWCRKPSLWLRGLSVSLAFLLCLPPPDVLAQSSASKSIFANRQASHASVQQRNLQELDAKQGMLKAGARDSGSVTRDPGHASRVTAPLSLAGLQDLSAIYIPPEDGQVLEVWQPDETVAGRRSQVVDDPSQVAGVDSYDVRHPTYDAARGPTVLLLQDLHTQPDAQLAEGRILQHLYKTYNLKLMASEGATGPFQLEFFQQFPKDQQARTIVADAFLHVGEMTGHEYQAIIEQLPIQIYGVEDEQLYEDNGDVFRKVLEIAPHAHQVIGRLQQALDALQPRLYPQQLQAFLEQTAQFHVGARAFPEHVAFLVQQAQQQGLDSAGLAPNLMLLQQVQQMEAAVDRTKVETELQRLLSALSTTWQQGGHMRPRLNSRS